MKVLEFLKGKELYYGVAVNNPAYKLNALSGDKVVVTPMLLNARNRSIWQEVKENGPRFYILEKTDIFFRKETEEDPALTKVSLGPYDIFYGRSKLLEKLLEIKTGQNQ